jgi:hypothetical protein
MAPRLAPDHVWRLGLRQVCNYAAGASDGSAHARDDNPYGDDRLSAPAQSARTDVDIPEQAICVKAGTQHGEAGDRRFG